MSEKRNKPLTANTADRLAQAALIALVTVQFVMLLALLTETPPHPPLEIPPFAMGPFLGAALAIALAAIVTGPTATLFGKILSVIAAVFALVSFGPQKFFDSQFPLIWPAVLTAQSFVVVLVIALLKSNNRD